MENVKNINLVYGIIGLIIGIALTSLLFWNNNYRNVMQQSHQSGMMMGNVPMNMESMMSGMMAGLKGKTGDAFDKEFLSGMIIHHQGAVEMAEAVLATSKRPELIKLANDIISAQTKEIGMMQDWQKAWFK